MKKSSKKEKNKGKPNLLSMLLSLALFVTAIFIVFSSIKNSALDLKGFSLLNTSETIGEYYISPLNDSNDRLKKVVEESLKDKQGIYGVYIKNIKTKEQFTLNEDAEFVSASLYKLWVMATVYQQIDLKIITLDTVLSEYIVDLNSFFGISPAYQEQWGGVLSLSVREALFQMITHSDNYSALLLAKKVSFAEVSVFLANYGFLHSSVGESIEDPFTTAKDVGEFYFKLYDGKLISKNSSDEMINLLKAQTLNGKIPKYLPTQLTIAHKTGELYDNSHDAGIIYSPSGDYIFVVLTKTNNTVEATETIANLSKDVYEYFNE